jgi:predicted nucleic acid-binding protein
MSQMPERLVIANTSPLLYLHLGGQLDVLQMLYRSIVTPPAVGAELNAGLRAGVDVPRIEQCTWIQVKPVQSLALIPAIVDLGPGEAEVIALGLENPGSLLILDDRMARRVAALNRLTCTGTAGVLVKAKLAGFLPAIEPALKRMRDAGLWLSDELVAMVLALAGEKSTR